MDETELISVLQGLMSIQIEQLEEIQFLKQRISRLENFISISEVQFLDISNVDITNLT